jgi:hypothetical protein
MVKKQDIPCMFCGGLPCSCDGVKKPRKTKAKSNSVPVAPDSTTDDLDFGAIPEPVARKFKTKKRDLSLESALRNLREIVCEDDQYVIDHELEHSYLPDMKKRISDWRTKNE